MTHSRLLKRFALLLVGAVVASSCDTRLPTQAGSVLDDVERPQVTFKANVGDSILVTAKLHDDVGLQSLTIQGFSLRGSATLGTQDTVIRYPLITAPSTAGFTGTVKDTTISRYLKVATPVDSVLDSLY